MRVCKLCNFPGATNEDEIESGEVKYFCSNESCPIASPKVSLSEWIKLSHDLDLIEVLRAVIQNAVQCRNITPKVLYLGRSELRELTDYVDSISLVAASNIKATGTHFDGLRVVPVDLGRYFDVG